MQIWLTRHSGVHLVIPRGRVGCTETALQAWPPEIGLRTLMPTRKSCCLLPEQMVSCAALLPTGSPTNVGEARQLNCVPR